MQILLSISILIILIFIMGLIGYFIQKDRIHDISREAQEKMTKATLDFTTKLQEIQFEEEDKNEHK